MADNEHSYPSDEFDNPPRGPIGLHRGNKSLAVRLTPYIVTIVVALALAVLAWAFFSGAFTTRRSADVTPTAVVTGDAGDATATPAEGGDTASPEPDASEEPSDASSEATSEATEQPSEEASEEPSDEPSESPSAAAQANTAAVIIVYNGSGVNGAAASQARTLQAGGYTNVSAANPRDASTLPSQTTVWYRTEDDLATAQDVASKLGIDQIVQASSISCDVAVVLR